MNTAQTRPTRTEIRRASGVLPPSRSTDRATHRAGPVPLHLISNSETYRAHNEMTLLMNFTPKTQTLPLSVSVCAIAATLGVMAPQAVFAEDPGNDVPPLSRCLTVADLNGDGILTLGDSIAGMQLYFQDSADYYAMLLNTGCSYYLDFGPDSKFIANLAEYTARCAMTDNPRNC